jgi:DNA invertase Pin-like site-specific DNA recombinase
MTDVCRILMEVSPDGIGLVFIDAVAPAERAKALRFLASQMAAVDRLDAELKKKADLIRP